LNFDKIAKVSFANAICKKSQPIAIVSNFQPLAPLEGIKDMSE